MVTWEEHIKKHIEDTYGKETRQWVSGLGSGDLEKIADCIINIVGDVYGGTVGVITNLAIWSVSSISEE